MSAKRNFNSPYHCGLCGMPMKHSRLGGYECFNRNHREIIVECMELADYDEDITEELLKVKRVEMGYSQNE